MKIGLFDHHDYPYPTNGIGGIIGLNELLFVQINLLLNLDLITKTLLNYLSQY